jgi:hypothetical protein
MMTELKEIGHNQPFASALAIVAEVANGTVTLEFQMPSGDFHPLKTYLVNTLETMAKTGPVVYRVLLTGNAKAAISQ